MQRALLGLLLVVPACVASPADTRSDSPVYEREREGVVTHWRYVPLSPRAAVHPPPADFARVAARCAEQATCLAERGFYPAQCSDGRDNDGDGLTDHPTDPGCADRHALQEAPACDDDLDNDGDGDADWDGGGFTHPDPECLGAPSRDREHPAPSRWRWLPF